MCIVSDFEFNVKFNVLFIFAVLMSKEVDCNSVLPKSVIFCAVWTVRNRQTTVVSLLAGDAQETQQRLFLMLQL